MHYYISALQNYAVFSGRTTRKQYWMFVLFNVILFWTIAIPIDMLALFAHIDVTFIPTIYAIGLFCPVVSAGVRRLHDTDRSGWWMTLCLIPLVGTIALWALLCIKGTPGVNRFGTDNT